MKQILKTMARRVARTRALNVAIRHLVYPTLAECLRTEVQPDGDSPSGIVEALSWKLHSYLVLNEELRPTGENCSPDGMRCDRRTRNRVLDVVLSQAAATKGDVLEFGVFQGDSLSVFAQRCPDRHVYGFDSFEGLPDDWWNRPKGTFKTEPPRFSLPNVTLVKGLFAESLPRFLTEWPGQASIIHVDCVLYQSTMACLLPILARLQTGTVLLFDEYYNYPDFALHEWLAWRQIRAANAIAARCVAYDGRRAAFRVAELGGLRSGV